jgi:hypothetical protein
MGLFSFFSLFNFPISGQSPYGQKMLTASFHLRQVDLIVLHQSGSAAELSLSRQ